MLGYSGEKENRAVEDPTTELPSHDSTTFGTIHDLSAEKVAYVMEAWKMGLGAPCYRKKNLSWATGSSSNLFGKKKKVSRTFFSIGQVAVCMDDALVW